MRTFVLSGALAVLAGGSAVEAASLPTRIPIEKLAALPSVNHPILSPDGHRLAARSEKDGNVSILIIDADHPEAPAKAIAVGKTTIGDLQWAGNHRLLLQVEEIAAIEGEDFPYLRLIAVDVDTGASRVLDPKSRGLYAGDVLYADDTGNWALVASQDDVFSYPSVKRVDLATGNAQLAERARDNVWDWYSDDHGVVRAGIAYEGQHWTVYYRDNAGEKLKEIHGKFPKDDDSKVDRFIFRGGNSWVLTNERTGRFGLYKFDMKTGTVGDAIYENPEVDVDDVYYDGISGDVDAVKYEDDRAHIYWIDPDMRTLQKKLDQAIQNATNITVGWSKDDKRALVLSASAADPGLYYLLDRNTSQMHAVLNPYPDIDPDELTPVEPIHYQARDGLTIRGYLTLPRGRDAKNLPLIVLPHGGPFARDDWEYDPFVQFFANRGYAVLQPEFRGSTGYGKDFVERGFGEIGKKMQDDLDDGVDWLVKSGQVDPKRVCIAGLSYGGYAAMWGAIRNPDRYRCAISWAGPSDMPAMMHYDRKQFSAARYFSDFRKRFPTDDELKAVSPINFADKLKIPLLIGQGEGDQTVPSKQTHRMVDALTKAGANVTSVFYKDSRHDFGSSKDLQDWLTRVGAFLVKYNPA